MRKGKSYGEAAELSLTSMMDVMTIILVFLLKQIDAEGQLVTAAENLVLPNSTSTKMPSEVSMNLTVDPDWVLVDGVQVIKTDDVSAQDSLFVEVLNEVLKDKREIEENALMIDCNRNPNGESCGKIGEGGKIIIQLDKNTHFGTMFKIMATCGFSGFSNISFAVNMKNPEE